MAQQPAAEQIGQQQLQQQEQLYAMHRPQSDDDVEVIQVATPRHDIYEKICRMVEKFATTRIGQFVIERSDRALRVIEDTTIWSLPQDDEHSYYKLERPLPWLPFLALIMTLRCARILLSVAALMIGNGPVMPNNVIYFLQTRRRKLRALRVHGMKVRRQREIQAKARKAQLEMGFLGKLTKLLSPAFCHSGQYYEATMNVFVHQENESNQQTPPQQRLMRAKRHRSDDDIQDLTCDQMLSKYANEDSDDDSDFIPNAADCDVSSSSDNNTSFGTTTDEMLEDNDGNDGNVESESESDIKGKSNDQTTSKPDGKTLDRSVEMSNELSTESMLLMPKPLHEIKKEPVTDIESGNEPLTPMENGPSNGDEERGEGDVASLAGNMLPSTSSRACSSTSTIGHTPNLLNLLNANAPAFDQQNCTPGHESAARTQPLLPMMTIFGVSSATARSPLNFNATYKSDSNLKNPPPKQSTQNQIEAHHSTLKSAEESATSDTANQIDTSSKLRKHHHHQSQRPNYRYGGKNRH